MFFLLKSSIFLIFWASTGLGLHIQNFLWTLVGLGLGFKNSGQNLD